MEIFVFVLLAVIWAAFLLPSFFDSRSSTPTASTRNFARSTALLASVATSRKDFLIRQRTLARRRRILIVLGMLASATLALAIWQGSLLWLGITLAVDVLLAGYVGMLMHLKQRQADHGTVVPLVRDPYEVVEETASVRVIAG